VVSKPHDIKGESVFAYVVLNRARPEGRAAAALIDELRGWVGNELSPIAKPDEIRLTDNLPKTRSGKIMRRLLRAIARGEEITQDMSTLENPGILEMLRGGAAPAKAAARKPAARTRVKPAKKAAAKRKPAKPSKAARHGKAAKRGKAAARTARRSASKRKVAVKARRAKVKSPSRKPRGKK
jgi:hypothetical protein